MNGRIFLFLFILGSCTPSTIEENVTSQGENETDSIVMIHEYAGNPLTCADSNLLNYVREIAPKPLIRDSSVTSIYDSTYVFVSRNIRWGNSECVGNIFKDKPGFYLDYIDIQDSNFVFNRGIHVGMTTKDLFAKFYITPSKSSECRFVTLYVEHEIGNQVITFFINNGVVSRITYQLPWD